MEPSAPSTSAPIGVSNNHLTTLMLLTALLALPLSACGRRPEPSEPPSAIEDRAAFVARSDVAEATGRSPAESQTEQTENFDELPPELTEIDYLFADAERAIAGGDLTEASRMLGLALDLSPYNDAILNRQLELQLERDELIGASEVCAVWATSSPDHLVPGTELLSRQVRCSSIAARSGQLELAETLARTGLEASPRCLQLWVNLTGVLLIQQRPSEVLMLLEHHPVLEASGAISGSLLTNIGSAYVQLERFREAEPILRRAMAQRPESVDPMINLSEVLRQLGRISEADELMNQILQLEPTNEVARRRLGLE